MCKCGLNHRGYEVHLCRIELSKRGGALLSPAPKQTILSDPGGSVSKEKAQSKPVARNSTTRVAELRKRKAATGLIEVRGIWTHPDDVAAIKKYAKELDGNRSKVS